MRKVFAVALSIATGLLLFGVMAALRFATTGTYAGPIEGIAAYFITSAWIYPRLKGARKP